MSLRKSPQLTPALLAAAQHNAQHSTGSRSAAAKQNSKLNALKHGGRVSDENRRQATLALGEHPQEFENLKQELTSAFGPGDALWQRQTPLLRRVAQSEKQERFVWSGIASGAVDPQLREFRRPVAGSGYSDNWFLMM